MKITEEQANDLKTIEGRKTARARLLKVMKENPIMVGKLSDAPHWEKKIADGQLADITDGRLLKVFEEFASMDDEAVVPETSAKEEPAEAETTTEPETPVD